MIYLHISGENYNDLAAMSLEVMVTLGIISKLPHFSFMSYHNSSIDPYNITCIHTIYDHEL